MVDNSLKKSQSASVNKKLALLEYLTYLFSLIILFTKAISNRLIPDEPLFYKEKKRPLIPTLSANTVFPKFIELEQYEKVGSTTQGICPSTNTFFKNAQKSQLDTYKTTVSHDFNNKKEAEAFISMVNEIIVGNETPVTIKDEQECSHVTERYIKELIAVIKSPASLGNEFWDRLKQMTDKDIIVFVSQLSAVKAQKYSPSELDYLWCQCNGVELEPSKIAYKTQKFIVIISALSDEQFKVSVNSADFLKILNKDSYMRAAGQALNSYRLGVFAASPTRHHLLNEMIKKLTPDAYLLGKLFSIMPYATSIIRGALVEQLAHLPYSASFNIELTKLADHYINSSETTLEVPPPCFPGVKSKTSKWAPVTIAQPVYASLYSQREDFSDDNFDAFVDHLNATTYIMNEQEIIETLNGLSERCIKRMVEKASLVEFKELLTHFWHIESKPLTHKSYKDSRENRLKIVLEHLSEAQLKVAIKNNKFWEIFRNTQEPYCKMAAEVLSPGQFQIIISNTDLNQHADFAVLITQIKKDSSEEKERLFKIIEAVITHTTPWFAQALELKIKSTKFLTEHFNGDLKKYLSESLGRQEVFLRYQKDRQLNKKALAQLLMGHHNPHSMSIT